MSDDSIYDDINLTKRKTITNGKKYDFYIYKTLKLEKQFSKGKFGKGDTSISQVKNYKLQDDEKDLKEKIIKFRQDELDHKDIAYESGATKKGLYNVLDKIIKTSSRVAIAISEKI